MASLKTSDGILTVPHATLVSAEDGHPVYVNPGESVVKSAKTYFSMGHARSLTTNSVSS